jgi:hypothetical protein
LNRYLLCGLLVSETKNRKVAGRRVIIALVVACVVLASCLVWQIVVLSSLSSQISSLNSLLNATPTTVSEIVNNGSSFVNRTVVLEGNIRLGTSSGDESDNPFCNYELSSSARDAIGMILGDNVGLNESFYTNQTVDVPTILLNSSAHGITKVRVLNSSLTVRVYGVVKEGQARGLFNYTWIFYYIKAEKVELR